MTIRALLIVLLTMLMPIGAAYAQVGMTEKYVCRTTSVTSASTPVQILPSAQMVSLTMKVRNGAAVCVLAFPYQGALPAGAPTNCASGTGNAGCIELCANAFFFDNTAVPTAQGQNAIGESWAAILESGTTAVLTDSCYR
jgi:hypothetical protein